MPRGTRNADIAIGTKNRGLDKGLRDARNKLKRFARGSSGDVRRAFKGVGKKLAVGAAVGTALFVKAGVKVKEFETKLTRLQIQSGRSAAEMSEFRSQIDTVSRSTGIAREELLAGAAGFVSFTGDIDGAKAGLETFARVAVASGASMEDITGTAGALQKNLDIDPRDFEKAFSILLAQGKAGAIELNDMAGLIAGITPTFSEFGTKGTAGLAQMGGMLQIVRRGFGSASEAVTGFQGMMIAFTKKAGVFEKAGIKIFEGVDEKGNKKMRTLADIIKDLGESDLAKDPEKLAKAFGRIEGLRAFRQIQGASGDVAALSTGLLDAKDVASDFATFQASAAGKLQKSFNQLKQSVAEAFTPERIDAFVKAILTLTGALSNAVGFLTDIGDAMVRNETISKDGSLEDLLTKRKLSAIDRKTSVGEGGLLKSLAGFAPGGAAAVRAAEERSARNQARQEIAANPNLQRRSEQIGAAAALNEANLAGARSPLSAAGKQRARAKATRLATSGVTSIPFREARERKAAEFEATSTARLSPGGATPAGQGPLANLNITIDVDENLFTKVIAVTDSRAARVRQ